MKRMVSIVTLAAIVIGLGMFAAPAQAQATGVMAALSSQQDLSTFVSALKTAGLDKGLDDPAQIVTIFAPTNTVFAELPETALADKAILTQLLTYHIVDGALPKEKISTTGQLVKTRQGESFTVTNTGFGKTLAGGAYVIKANISAGQSVIHTIDALLLPSAIRPKISSPRIRTAYNRELGRAFIQDLLSALTLDRAQAVADAIMSEKYIQHNPLVDQGRTGLLGFLKAMPAFFSDTRFTLKDVVASEDTVVARWVWSGKHTGTFLGYPATNKAFEMGVIDLWTVENGVLYEHWDELGWSYALAQLGIYQFPPEPIGPVKGYPTKN